MSKVKIEKRKLLLLVPVPVLLCAALLFYALGGGKAALAVPVGAAGLNVTLPEAKLKSDSGQSKLEVYQRTEKDSSRGDQAIRGVAEKLGFKMPEDPQTKAINARLAELNQVVQAPAGEQVGERRSGAERRGSMSGSVGNSDDVERLERLMRQMQQKSRQPDPEMIQLNGMMEKIMQIQNPELVRQRLKEKEATVALDSVFRAIPAVISRNQKIVEGAVVELQLTDSLVLGRDVVPKGYLIYGLASFSNQRLNLQIKNIRLGTSIIPVKLTVFDRRDGMAGINAPEAELSGAVNNGVADAAGSIGITGFDLTTQLAGAGIDAAKGLLRKKVKKVRQKLQAGYPLLLRNEEPKLLRGRRP